MTATDPALSVIVPVHNGERVLRRSLAALADSDLPRDRWELIVVDDSSDDATVRVAEEYADRVPSLTGGPYGPARARNRGTEVAHGEILVFVDADVCVHPDALRRFLDLFAGDPDLGAAFGAYDVAPPAPGLVSQYRNLLHHYVHATHAGEADTFWAGCGAVRRRVFLEAGGFDAERYPRPQIEDIELGYRIRALGWRILLRPEIRGTHLKQWTLGGMVVNDARDRGLPWMRLLLAREAVGAGSLNIRGEERLLTAAAGVGTLAAVGAPLAPRVLGALAAGSFGVILIRNASLFRWFGRVRDPWFALRVVPLRLLYYVLNAAVAAVALVRHHTLGIADGRVADRPPGAVGEETVEPLELETPARGRVP